MFEIVCSVVDQAHRNDSGARGPTGAKWHRCAWMPLFGTPPSIGTQSTSLRPLARPIFHIAIQTELGTILS